MVYRTLRGSAKHSVAPCSAAALLASAGLLVVSGSAVSASKNPQNGPAPSNASNTLLGGGGPGISGSPLGRGISGDAVPAVASNGPDLNGSGYVDFPDLMMMLTVLSGAATVDPAWVTAADLNGDGEVDFEDLSVLLSAFGQFIPPPPPEPPAPPAPPPEPPAPETPPSGGGVALDVGNGFWGPIAAPSVVGDPNGPGADAKAIARWNAVPGQFITGEFNFGVVAFHMNGINRVEFIANGGEPAVVQGMSENPSTGNKEYWVTLDTSDLSDGPVEVRAVVYPNTGIPRVLQGEFNYAGSSNGEHSLFLNVRHGDAPAVYVTNVDGAGSDSNPGTREAPFATIAKAIRTVPDGGDIVLLNPGDYMSPQNIYGHWARNHEHWITIRPDEGIGRDEVTITDSTRRIMRANASRLRWQDLTFDFGKISQMYALGEHMNWLDRCAMLDSDGWDTEGRPPSVRNPWFATEVVAENKLYAYPGATLARNCVARQISGDVFQNVGMAVGCEVENVDGSLLNHHTDLVQVFGARDNLIVYDLTATGLVEVQAFFLEPSFEGGPDESARWLSNSAYVDISVDVAPVFRWNANAGQMVNMGGAPWTQLLSRFDHVLFDNVELANQRFVLRSDVTGVQAFAANNVVIRDVGLHPISHEIYLGASGSIPEGVEFVNCYEHPDAAEWGGD